MNYSTSIYIFGLAVIVVMLAILSVPFSTEPIRTPLEYTGLLYSDNLFLPCDTDEALGLIDESGYLDVSYRKMRP